jgi:RNase P/RNase MRP subunit p30
MGNIATTKCPYIDAGIFVYPLSHTTTSRMVLTARNLGFNGFIIREPWSRDTTSSPLHSFPHSEQEKNFFLIRGRVYSALNQKELRRAIQNRATIPSVEIPTLHIVDAGDAAYNRWVLTTPISILSRMYAVPRQAFDHVCARSAVDHNICVDINLAALIPKGAPRQKALQQYEHVITLARKYEFGLTISSGATGYLGLCTPREIMAICMLFGMDEEMVVHSLSTPFHLLYPQQSVRRVVSELRGISE